MTIRNLKLLKSKCCLADKILIRSVDRSLLLKQKGKLTDCSVLHPWELIQDCTIPYRENSKTSPYNLFSCPIHTIHFLNRVTRGTLLNQVVMTTYVFKMHNSAETYFMSCLIDLTKWFSTSKTFHFKRWEL